MRSNFIDEIKLDGNYVFVSPHIDDAIFSCGGLIDELVSNGASVTIINVFTKIPTSKNSLSAKAYLKQSNFDSAVELYKKRIEEETALSSKITINIINLNYVEALWRENNSLIGRIFGNILPELKLIYPVYRLHACQGKISKCDIPLAFEIAEKISNICQDQKANAVFGPVGFGKHVDHILTKMAVEKVNFTKFFWADYPYIVLNRFATNFKKYYDIAKVEPNWDKKVSLMKMYNNQFRAIFANKQPKHFTELYYKEKTDQTQESIYTKLLLFIKILVSSPIETLFIFTYPNNTIVDIYDFDEEVLKKGTNFVKRLNRIFPDLEIKIMGSTGLRVMGQRDLDIFIKCDMTQFNKYYAKINEITGAIGKKKRKFIEWEFYLDGIDTQLVMMHPYSYIFKRKGYIHSLLINNRDKYIKFKQNAIGMTLRQYEYAKQLFFCIDLKRHMQS